MKHQITEIIDAAVALLQTRFKNVYRQRYFAAARARLPCVLVSFHSRSSSVVNAAPVELRHEAQIAVTVLVAENDQADELATEMLGITEQLFYANPTLKHQGSHALADDFLPQALAVEYEESGENVLSAYQQLWRAVWYEQPADTLAALHAETAPVELMQLATDWQIKGSNTQIDAQDIIPKETV